MFQSIGPREESFADLMYEHPCSPILPVSYNYPRLIPEETEMTCSKVTLQKQLGPLVAIRWRIRSLGSKGKLLTTHKNLERGRIWAVGIIFGNFFYMNTLCISFQEYFLKGEKLQEAENWSICLLGAPNNLTCVRTRLSVSLWKRDLHCHMWGG